MECLYYLFLNEKQVREIISDAVATIEIPHVSPERSLSYHIKLERKNKGLNIECIMCMSDDLDEILTLEDFDLEINSMEDIAMAYKEKGLNHIYFNMGEESIKASILEVLKAWKMTAKITKLPFININFRGEINENLNCLITASKTAISAEIEKEIFDTKRNYVENIDDLKVEKYRLQKE